MIVGLQNETFLVYWLKFPSGLWVPGYWLKPYHSSYLVQVFGDDFRDVLSTDDHFKPYNTEGKMTMINNGYVEYQSYPQKWADFQQIILEAEGLQSKGIEEQVNFFRTIIPGYNYNQNTTTTTATTTTTSNEGLFSDGGTHGGGVQKLPSARSSNACKGPAGALKKLNEELQAQVDQLKLENYQLKTYADELELKLLQKDVELEELKLSVDISRSRNAGFPDP